MFNRQDGAFEQSLFKTHDLNSYSRKWISSNSAQVQSICKILDIKWDDLSI